MITTPAKQPVVADNSWVDVYVFDINRRIIDIESVAVKKREGVTGFRDTVESIIQEGIWSADGKTYYPPSCIIRIKDRK